MQNKFEQNIEQKMQQLLINPEERVWQNIATALETKKREKPIIWWWFAGILAILVISGGIFYTSKQLNSSTHLATNSAIKRELINKNANTAPINEPKEIIQPTANIQPKIDKKLHEAIHSFPERRNPITAFNQTNTPNNTTSTFGEENTREKNTINQIKNDSAIQIDNHLVMNKTENSIIQNTHIVPVLDTIQQPSKQTDKKEQKIKSRFTTFEWTVGGGINFNNGQMQLFQTGGNSVNASAYLGNYTNPQATTNNYPSKVNTYGGFHFSAGFQMNKPVGKHWNWFNNIQYTYIQNKQWIGSARDTTGFDIDNQQYFTIGNETTVTNFSHWLQLTTGMKYWFTNNQNPKWGLSIGIGGIIPIYSKWLITNSDAYQMFYKASAVKKWQWHGRLGIMYQLTPSANLSLYAQQNISPIYKWNNEKSYLNQFGLQFSKTFQSKKQSKN